MQGAVRTLDSVSGNFILGSASQQQQAGGSELSLFLTCSAFWGVGLHFWRQKGSALQIKQRRTLSLEQVRDTGREPGWFCFLPLHCEQQDRQKMDRLFVPEAVSWVESLSERGLVSSCGQGDLLRAPGFPKQRTMIEC